MAQRKGLQAELLGGTVASGGVTIQFGPDSAAAAREIEWLTDGAGVVLRWPEPDGPWYLRLDLANVDGRAQVVGLHIQSYREGVDEHDQPMRVPGPHGLAEVTHAVVRDIKMGQIAESGRRLLSLAETAKALTETSDPAIKERITQQLLDLTNRGTPRKRRPPADHNVLAQIADLYQDAIAAGGAPGRKPARYVEEKLRQAGLEIDGPAVRKLVARVRSRGLLAPTTPRRPGWVTTGTLPGHYVKETLRYYTPPAPGGGGGESPHHAAARILEEGRMVVLVGAEGTGRRAGALALLREHADQRQSLISLAPATSLTQLAEYAFENGRGYVLLDRIRETQETAARRIDVDRLTANLASAGAYLVITAGLRASDLLDLKGLVVEWRPPDPGQLFETCLDRLALPEIPATELERVRERVHDLQFPRHVVALAEGLAKGVDAAL